METSRTYRLGLDVGGVIIEGRSSEGNNVFFGPNYLETPAVEGAFEGIADLYQSTYYFSVCLISKAGFDIQRRTLNWMDSHNFWARTRLSRTDLYFCAERVEKARICQELGVERFVDDRLEVLTYLATVRHRFLFNPSPDEIARFPGAIASVTRVSGWKDLMTALRGDQ